MKRHRPIPGLVAVLCFSVTAAFAQFPSGRVSLDLRDANIRDVLWAFSKEHGMNVILGAEVEGTVTLTLTEVPISTAFQSILDNGNLGYTRRGNILRINTLATIQDRRDVEPLITRVIQLDYFTSVFGSSETNREAGLSGSTSGGSSSSSSSRRSGGGRDSRFDDDLEQLRESLEKHLSGKAGSSVTIIPRTNSLVITDIASNVDRLAAMARDLDKPSPQVLIEARVVEIDANYSRALGITTSISAERTQNTEFGGGVGSSFPGRSNAAGGAALDFFLTSIGAKNLTELSITLDAAESDGLARTLATPRVTTLNNKEAIITSGQRIPFTTIGSIDAQGGTNLIATVEFVDAALELAVTPHVTSNGHVILKVRTSRNTADFANTVFDNPTITTREARNEVMVPDGHTVLIGGIYTKDRFLSDGGVPYLKDIPVLGHLFRNESRQDDTVELLFLITPRIVSSQALRRTTDDAMKDGLAPRPRTEGSTTSRGAVSRR